jgi:hypothetical protein
MKTVTLWLITVPRIMLGAIFASAALSYFSSVVFGWALLPVPIPAQALQFPGGIIKIGYLWPPVIIVWFQIFLNPLPVPLATAALAVICELMLLRARAGRYASMFTNDKWSTRESTR